MKCHALVSMNKKKNNNSKAHSLTIFLSDLHSAEGKGDLMSLLKI